jgi:hypothetical protein
MRYRTRTYYTDALELLTGQAQRGGATIEPKAEKDSRLQDAG